MRAGARRGPVREVAAAVAALASLLLAAAPEAAACSVCFDLLEEARGAYYETTILLIAVPFAFLAGVFVWLRRAMRAREGDTPRR